MDLARKWQFFFSLLQNGKFGDFGQVLDEKMVLTSHPQPLQSCSPYDKCNGNVMPLLVTKSNCKVMPLPFLDVMSNVMTLHFESND